MPNTSISGLVSGLDTSTIISQLMQLEARPQNLLKTKMSTEQKVVSALQGLNTKLAGITSKAADLAKSAAWAATKASSSNDKVLVTADAGTSPTSITFKINSVAASAGASYVTTGTVDAPVMDPDLSYRITYDDGRVAEEIATGDGSMQAIADAVNGTQGLAATLVKVGVDTGDPANPRPIYQLQVTSTATGKNSGFTITQFDPDNPTVPPASPTSFMGGSTAPVSGGTDAELVIGGQTYTYSSNTITGLVPGVDVTVAASAAGTSATISVARDVDSLAGSVKAMVDAVNAAIDEIGTLTAYDGATKKAGLLGGDSTVRSIRDQLIGAVTNGVANATGTGTESLATGGIQVDRYGKLTFDEAKFKTAYAADPAATERRIAGNDADTTTGTPAVPGFADNLEVLGKRFSDSLDGTLTGVIKSRQSAIRGLEDAIADWDVRLAARQTTLQRQYTALESALGRLQSQSSWLAGQVASLPTMSSGQ